MNRLFCCLVAAVSLSCIVGCGAGFRDALNQYAADKVESSSDDEVIKMFEQADAQCPVQVDPITRLMEVNMLDEKNFEFCYEVSDSGASLMRRVDANTMRSNAIAALKGNAIAVAIAERDLSVHHVYETKAGAPLLSYVINKDALEGKAPGPGTMKSNTFSVQNVSGSDQTNVNQRGGKSGSNPRPVDSGASRGAGGGKSHRTPDNPAGIQTNPYL